jgi:hypothetical protein
MNELIEYLNDNIKVRQRYLEEMSYSRYAIIVLTIETQIFQQVLNFINGERNEISEPDFSL